MKHLFYLFVALTLVACSSSKNVLSYTYTSQKIEILGVSTDETYGFTPENAINCGGGPEGERAYLNAIAGPNDETVVYSRLGSCCAVESENSPFGKAILDKYEVKLKGKSGTYHLYLN